MIVTVCAAGCTYASLATAAQRVPAGTTIVVRGKTRGGVTIERPMTIRGSAGAAIEMGDSGIIVRAPHVTIEGLRFSGYGLNDPSGQHAAVVLTARDDVVRGNSFQADAFAVTLVRADGAAVENNTFNGLENSQPQVAGDSLHLWYSSSVRVSANTFENGRDILISYSPRLVFSGNVVRTSRYGLHDMFSDGMRVRGNLFENDEIGTNFMYAKDLDVSGNIFRANHGAAGYGIGLEDVDSSRINGNRFEQNRVALNSVDSPSEPGASDDVQGNVFTHNGSALALQSDPHALRILANAFVDNLEDVAVSGGGTAAGVMWTHAGRGNYWSSYAGYDRDGDGIGDISYAPQPAFDTLTDAHPELEMFRYSPAALAVQFAARTLPQVAAQPKFTDSAPLMTPPRVPGTMTGAAPNPFTALLALLAAVPLAAMRGAGRASMRRSLARARALQTDDLALDAAGARKLYAGDRGMKDATLSVRAGEAVALWGPNGAGKTTFFRCVLGERLDAGSLRVFGRAPSAEDREARSVIGYAPQYLPDFDARVGELAEMVAAIRGVCSTEAERVLDLVQLGSERMRFVNELSGGMRQRLSIALALIGDPPLLLLDEPTAGLDRRSRETVVAVLKKERARGKTLVLTSHLLEDVCALSDRVVTMECGSVIDSMPVQAFAARYLRNIS